MSEPLVSIVIATYNMGQYLPDAIHSVLAQTYQNVEVVVVDDGSEDDTSIKMKSFANNSKIRYLPQKNLGQPKAKNAGVKACKGEFIAFCDADDLWTADKLEKQLPFFDDPLIGVVYSEVSNIDGKGNELQDVERYSRYNGQITEKLIMSNFIPFGSAVIRKECVDELGAFDESLPMGIDWDLWLRYSTRYFFKYIPDETYIYRIWEGQMSSNHRGRYKNAEKIMSKFLKQNPGLLSPEIVKTAWADIYTHYAMAIATSERKIWEPLTLLFKAICFDFFYWPTWKGLIKLLIRRV